MTAHNIEAHAVDSLLHNTLQLHRQLNKSHPGVTRPLTHTRQNRHQPHSHGSAEERTQAGSVSFGAPLATESNAAGGTVMSKTLSASCSSSSIASPRLAAAAAIIASPPASTAPKLSSSSSTPSSPTQPSFSAASIPRLPSASTFVPYNELSVGKQAHSNKSAPLDKSALPSLSVDTASLAPSSTRAVGSAPYTRQYTKSLSSGIHSQPNLAPHPHVRRNKTSLSTLANIDHNNRFLHHFRGGYDPGKGNSTISINVRFVSKDLWVRVEIPRDIPVRKARDLVLEHCQLTMTPPSAPSSVADTTVMDDESALAAIPKAVDEQALDKDVSQRELASIDAVGSSSDANKTPAARSRMTKGTHRSAAHGDIQSSYSEPSLAKLALSNNINGGVGKDTRRSHMPLQEQGSQQKAAEALVARLDMFAHSINGIGDEAAKINYLKDVTLKHGPTGAHNGTPSSTHPTGPSRAQQLKRLLSTSPVHNEDIQGTSPPDRASRDVGASRLGHISGWTHWRDRHNSNSGKQIERATSDQGDIPVDCSKAVQPYYNGGFKGDQEAWRQSFGLFWVAAGHWLDDSRTINSYSFKPQDLLELQLRNHYIQLPPPDGNLTYYDHYAEGILFKLSKKNRPVSMFTNHGSRESQGVWKERWVVLQGSKLLIYHKRKDTTKKTIDLPTPLHIITRTLPRNPRQFFKVTSSSTATMSSTMITLDVSPDPMVPKLCFRGISENEVNHWTRIFNSLNNNAAPLSSPLVAQGGFGSPNLGSLESMPGRSMDSSNSLASSLGGYSSERKRNHTTNNTFHNTVASTMPSIDPVLISNAAAAISNLNSMTNSNHPTTINGHRRNISQTTNLSGSMLNNRDMNLLQNHPLTTSTKEDIRRRAITEPNRFRLISMQPPAQRGHAKHGSKVSAPELDTSQAMDVSNVSDVPFMLDSPPGRKKRPVLGTEYLDNASQVLMATSSARSSTAPLYSGYIWMYMPNVIDTREDEAISKRTEKQPTASSFNDESIAIPTTTSSPSTSGSRTVSSNTNKASGRYVKCFAVISDQGHFQWVEVKKQNDLETEQELKARLKGSTSRSSYGIQLTAPKTGELDRDTDGCSIPEESSERLTGISSTEPSRCDTGLIQASVAHKLRLFFFCIKIPPSVLTEVLLNTAEATPRAPSIAATATATNAAAKAVNKIRHRLSSSLSNFTTSALPPLPNTKSQSLTGSISKGKNMTWPNMASSHDKEVFTQNHQQQQALHPEKAMTVPGGSIGSVLHKASSVSLKSTPPNITTVPSVALTLMLQGKDGESIQFASPTSAEPTSPVSPTSSSNNVLFLAQSLQKAVLLNRQHSVTNDEYSDSGSSSSENTTTQSTQSSPLGSSKARLTLSKAMAANQTALPDSAAMLEQSKLLQEQLETQNRHQRTEDRSRTRHQQEHHTHLQDSSGVYVDVNSSASINSVCPFMELSENVDGSDEAFVMLKGYTETEEGWKALQYALEKSLDGLIGEQTSALPPEDTLIPSYHSPPEVQLSEKAQRFLDAKESLIEEANLAASKAAVEAARCSTPDMVSGGSIVPSNGAVAQIRATSVSLTRWMNLTGGGEKDREKSKKASSSVPQADSDQNNGKHAYLGAMPARPITMTSCFVSSNGRSTAGASTASGASVFTTEASATGEGGGDDDIEAHTKRSAPPNNTLSPSMGAGASMLRPRPRLSQQRSADELSKASASETLDPSYDKGHHSRQHTSGGDVALNSTPTTIVQSISTEGVGNSSGGSNGRSGSACKATSRLQQRDFARTSQRRVTGASASDAIAATLVLLPSHFPESDIQLSPSLGYAPMMDGVAEETTEIRLNSFSPTAATSSKLAETTEMSVFAPGEEVSLMAAGNGGNKAAGSAEDTANRSSFHSLHSNNNNNNGRSSARRLSLMELGRSLGVHAAANDYGRTTKGEVTPPHLQPLDPGATMMMMMDGVDAQTQERVVEETVLVEDKAGGRGVSGSGSGSSSSSSHPGKKHQTVLGASKAVVSGVFGKFRKNIG